MTLTLLGIGVPLALGTTAVGFILIALSAVTAGLTIRAWREQAALSAVRSQVLNRASLVDTLRLQMKQGDAIYEEFVHGNYLPWWTAIEVWEPIGNALKWVDQVDDIVGGELPEWLPELRATGCLPDEIEPDDITVEDTERMLSGRVRVLGQIIRTLRSPEPS